MSDGCRATEQEPLPSIDVPVRDLGDFEWENPRVPPPPLQFDDAKAAFAAHSSLSMMRSLAVFSLCSVKVESSTPCMRNAARYTDVVQLPSGARSADSLPDTLLPCRLQPMVKYADTILRRLKMVFGRSLINGIVKRTFFLHFCAGETLWTCHAMPCHVT